MENYGLLIESDPNAKDWRFGGVTGMRGAALRSDGDWSLFLPTPEFQHAATFDTFACVTFSALNCVETLSKFLVQDWNKSDRFTAKMSGTSKSGNYMNKVGDSIRLDGLVNQEDWDFDFKDKKLTWEDYYATVPEQIKAFGKTLLEDWDINWHWVDKEDIREALKLGPLQIGVYAWPKPQANGMYTDGGITERNHAVELYNATDEYYEIYDHYNNVKKKLVPDYKIHTALQYFLTPKHPMPLKIDNNVLVWLSEGKGEYGLHLDGKIYIDDLAKIQATFIMRNNGNISNKTKTLLQKDWDTFPKFNLKNEAI